MTFSDVRITMSSEPNRKAMDLRNTTLNLELEGQNTITYGGDSSSEGIKLDNSSLFISGKSSLTMENKPGEPSGLAISGVDSSTVAITGGTITLIGQNIQMNDGTFIIGPEVKVMGNVPESAYGAGFVFENGEASVKGNPELPVDLTITEGCTLNVPEGTSLTVPKDVTLTVVGSLTVEGELTVVGSLTGDGAIRVETGGSITGDGKISGTVQHELTEEMVEIEADSYTYTGEAITPKVTITPPETIGEEYTQGEDYTVTYTNNTNAGEATITITPTKEGKLYGEAVKMYFTIAKAEPTFAEDWSVKGKTYDGEQISITTPILNGVNDETIADGVTLSYKGKEEADDAYTATAPTDAGDYMVKATFSGNNNYTAAEDVTKEFTIGKATPSYTVPADLTAIYGQRLAEVELPKADNGTWNWQDAETTLVGDAGEQKFKVTFTPIDTDNYIVVNDIEVTITVNQADISEQIKAESDTNISLDLETESLTLTAYVEGECVSNDGEWKWESKDESIATVTPIISTRAIVSQSSATVKAVGVGTTTITATYATDNYVGSVSYTLTVTEPEPEEPDPIPDPTPNYYNIQFENICEGVDASLSKSVVKEGNQVSVYVEVEEGYDAENLKVMCKRSLYGYWEEVEEGVQPGEYIIYNVYTDIYIKVEGVEKIEEEPTGMSDIEGTKVYAQNGNLYVYTSQPQEVMIITMNGTILKRERQEGLRFYPLPKGVYIICIGEERYKVRN